MKQSQRTKNRLREHAGCLVEIERRFTPHLFGGCESVLFLSSKGWFGWIPLHEIINEGKQQ
jgi:hypothetical protein